MSALGVIWRFALPLIDAPTLHLPAGARVLSVGPARGPEMYSNDGLDVWALVDPTATREPIEYPTLTITVDDPATGMTTTITGTATVDIKTATTSYAFNTGRTDLPLPLTASARPQSLKLRADWQVQDGRHYTITRMPTRSPVPAGKDVLDDETGDDQS